MFEKHGLDRIVFEVEECCYVPTPSKETNATSNSEPSMLDMEGGYVALGWCDMEAKKLNYEGDSEQDDEADEDCEGDNTQYNEVPIVEEESVDGDGGITQECMDGFEGYQFKSDDKYFNDSELEPDQVRIAKLVKGKPFKRMVDDIIRFHMGQFFNSKEHMRDVFKEVYNNKEAKVKWTAYKFEKLVKSNPNIDVKVIDYLLRENYKVSVDIQRLYRAKHKALKELAKDHAKCFGYLRRYAYMLNQRNPGAAVHICTQQPQPTFQRIFLSFEPQKVGFLEGCRPFIGVDECHLKGPFGGVLLSAVSLDANNGLFPIAVCI
ncbi:hypothetical protein Dsin_032416 [Dipteronia sinensis]|uniref:Uncharacterized protein n=1 Tax=Dipteronia sinensis TaxID=43782 RepID=A0AAD9ZPC2_9ROSI|nr:hypothetical protein Dsin_032416 [Dipteronia sinensis]